MRKEIDFWLSIILCLIATGTFILVSRHQNATMFIAMYWFFNSIKLWLLLKK